MLNSPYFRRLFIPYMLLIMCGTLIMGFWGAAQIRSTYLERTESALLKEAQLVGRLLDSDWAASDVAQLQQRIVELSGELEKRITIIAVDGTVLADSAHDPSTMDNHADRPEVGTSRRSGHGVEIRRSDTLHQEMMYLSFRAGDAAAPEGYIRLAIGLQALDRDIRALYAKLVAGAVVAFVVAGAVCYIITRRTSDPILQLTGAAETIAGGQLNHRVDIDEPGEIGTLARALNHLADSMEAQVERIAKDGRELHTVLSSMAEGVIAADQDGRITVANEASGRIFGFEARDAVGASLKDVVAHEWLMALADDVYRTGATVQGRIGSTAGAVDVEVIACPNVRDGQHGLIVVAHDLALSERYRQLRTEFVANVSHELRTPLTFIHGYVETLRDGAAGDAEKRDHFLSRIALNVEQLTNLVEDLLELSELQERDEQVDHEKIDIVGLLSKLCDTFAAPAGKKSLRLKFEKPAAPILLPGSQRHLEMACANLIDNAIKYTDAGGWITVGVKSENGRCIVTVEDTGIGIPREDLPRVFERFYRVDKSRSRAMGGTGLGLSIVKHVVEQHGGTVEVTSKPGQGSQFTLSLPLP